MKGATPKRVTSVPLSAPTAAPTASTITITAHTGGKILTSRKPMVRPSSSTPAITPARPTIEPTDRSMPAVRITISIPMARIALIATCLVIVTRLSQVR